MFKKVLSMILVLITLSAPLLGRAGTVHAATTDDMESSIEKQIRAFADSIDQKDADDEAALALAGHGMTGRGKTLKIEKNHALTATLFNSELMQNLLTASCTKAIQYMQRLDLKSITPVQATCCWYGAESNYGARIYTNASSTEYKDLILLLARAKPYTGKLNSYDNALDWMAGFTYVVLKIERSKVTATETVYTVSCTVEDRFDFAADGNSGFGNLVSGMGALLFKEFDWEASVSFELAVPCSCNHSSGMYRWTYDPENRTFSSDSSNGYTENATTRYTYESTTGAFSYYHELDKTVRLYHDKPWVLEYDVKNPGTFVLAPMDTAACTSHFSLLNRSQESLWFWDYECVTVSDTIKKTYKLSEANQEVYHYYGTALNTLFSYNTQNVYTLRLENRIYADGSNMVYLTVHNADTGELLLDKVPMDDYTRYETWVKEYELKSKSNGMLTGKDFYINYIGNKNDRFSAAYFELRIWENGEDGESYSYYEPSATTAPTCTKKGYTTYVCSACGHNKKSDYVAAAGHIFDDWTTVIPATCTEPGEEQRKCKNCNAFETREIAATGHNYDNYVCINCSDTLYTPGDVDMNGSIDVDDVLALLWNVLFPEDYPIEVDADFDSNGATDVDDVLTLLWHVLFPEDYPLN